MSDVVVAVSGYSFDDAEDVEDLRKAKGLGDKLVVILKNDEQARLERRKVRPESFRLSVVSAFPFVDRVVLSEDKGYGIQETLRKVKPNILIAGNDVYMADVATCREIGATIRDMIDHQFAKAKRYEGVASVSGWGLRPVW